MHLLFTNMFFHIVLIFKIKYLHVITSVIHLCNYIYDYTVGPIPHTLTHLKTYPYHQHVPNLTHSHLNSSKSVLVTLYFKVSLLQCNYTFKYWVILINYMYTLK